MYESCVLLKLNYAYIMYAITITISITKNKDGSFSDSVRMCIMELSGLKVACEK